MFFFAGTGPTTQRNCDIILHALVKMGTWVTAGCSAGLGKVGYAPEGLEGEGGIDNCPLTN